MKQALNSILMVEDEPDVNTIVQMALGMAGLSVRCEESGKQALLALATFKPDLILLDVMMPEMDGVAVFEALKKNPATEHIPVVFMTAKVQPSELAQYYDLGAIDVIKKPFDPMTLPHVVQDIWNRAPSLS